MIFSSPIGELIVMVGLRRRPHSLNISSEMAGPIKDKFHLELLWDGE